MVVPTKHLNYRLIKRVRAYRAISAKRIQVRIWIHVVNASNSMLHKMRGGSTQRAVEKKLKIKIKINFWSIV